ncbi:hypothetical protein B1759_15115 [Rubrivirga sp. SAORIC476]|uniref:DUF6884 domain-containing protein n=1 Tax=Rubrivirga sp. SAORIC476 TaxID=1961794 RepID=UPI000BA91C15|nr:DUF6884 domain-containing protein [Rubrivirga sp. SAORIC476]PAP79647.1 hypothetical protein B1759_15115 [Rubrivirga sp. SAORIC476]
MPDRVYLVGCGKSKLDDEAPARRLYTSSLFRKSFDLAQRRAEADGASLYIVSAFYGLVDPDEVLQPYERALGDLAPEDRRDWGVRVARSLAAKLQPKRLADVDLVVFAGRAYATALRFGVVEVTGAAVRIDQPLAGLGTGQRLQWLTRNLRSSDR